MATFTISLSGSTVVNGSKSWTVSDADVQLLVDYMAKKFAGRGNPPLPNGQALLAWVTSFVQTTVGEIQYQKTQEAQRAVTVSPLSFV